ncbi:MAG: glycine--tRNA ligase [Candidatus Spechtbacterales bacterium]
MDNIIALAKRRGFIYPGSEIYGGLANAWDYGPMGVELKNNVKQEWWRRFVQARADIVGIDAAILMNPKVWEASGHVGEFNDPLVEDKKTHERYRLDHLLEEQGVDVFGMSFDEMKAKLAGLNIKSPNGNELTEPKRFNMMLKTFLGPAEDAADKVYLRPETAQAIFVNFKTIIDTNRVRVPFGIAQIGKAFRNEITPGNFIFRTREFEQMEIEYFVRENEWEQYFEHWLEQMRQWVADLGAANKRVHEVEIPDGERAHYSKRTVDIEYDFPFGRKELYGLAYRGDFDLANHAKHSGQELAYTDPETGEKFVPHVIEPSFGVDRSVLLALLEAYHEDEVEGEKRTVMKFPFWLAPVKVAVFPLLRNNEQLVEEAREIFEDIAPHMTAQYDESGAIGRRYRRQDEIGTPLCVTIDHQTLEDNTVTMRHRDTLEQTRVPVGELQLRLQKVLAGESFKAIE